MTDLAVPVVLLTTPRAYYVALVVVRRDLRVRVALRRLSEACELLIAHAARRVHLAAVVSVILLRSITEPIVVDDFRDDEETDWQLRIAARRSLYVSNARGTALRIRDR
jgi:hypothetical protein